MEDILFSLYLKGNGPKIHHLRKDMVPPPQKGSSTSAVIIAYAIKEILKTHFI